MLFIYIMNLCDPLITIQSSEHQSALLCLQSWKTRVRFYEPYNISGRIIFALYYRSFFYHMRRNFLPNHCNKASWDFWKIILYLHCWKLMRGPINMFKNKSLNLLKYGQLVGLPSRCPCLYCQSLGSGCKNPAANLLMSLFWQDCIAHCLLMHCVAGWIMQHFLEL